MGDAQFISDLFMGLAKAAGFIVSLWVVVWVWGKWHDARERRRNAMKYTPKRSARSAAHKDWRL